MTRSEPVILVVEDEPNLAEIYERWLEEVYSVLTALSGEEALGYLDEADIVLLDRRMPGLSGDELLDEIRGRDLNCRVAMVTAVSPDFDIIDMGFDDYLVKPVSREQLTATVERLHRRIDYDTDLDTYATLVAKKAALETEKTDAELRANEEFNELERHLSELQESVDALSRQFDNDDVAAMLRDLTPAAGM